MQNPNQNQSLDDAEDILFVLHDDDTDIDTEDTTPSIDENIGDATYL